METQFNVRDKGRKGMGGVGDRDKNRSPHNLSSQAPEKGDGDQSGHVASQVCPRDDPHTASRFPTDNSGPPSM